MRKYLSLIILVTMLFCCNGCILFRNPINSWFGAEKNLDTQKAKVELVQNQIQTAQTNLNVQGKNYVYGTKLALQADPSTNIAHTVAIEFNDKAISVLGSPDMATIDELKKTISDLISTNTQNIIRGEQELATMDAKVTQLQNEKVSLTSQLSGVQDKLQTAENKLIKIGTDNSTLAQKWSNLVKWFWWIVIGLGVVFILRIIAAACPPPYNSAVQILAIPFTWLINGIKAFIPEAITAAGWVEKEYKTATSDLVSAIQDIKTQNPSLHSAISQTVAANVSDSAVPVIQQAKATQGIVS